MRKEIKEYLYTCDGCGSAVLINNLTSKYPKRPHAWISKKFCECEYDNNPIHTEWDLCPKCRDKEIPKYAHTICKS